MASIPTRLRALALYKELHRLGRDYPDPSYDFHGRIRRLYEKHRNLTDPEEIEKALRLADYIKKETLALYSLRKYRHLKRMYPETPSPQLDADTIPQVTEATEASFLRSSSTSS
ncbi:LYR motif-containing protein 5A [Termitomyces sp. J132]|nr:LYR motif-containing protein 5A [Termitomyces sp. J132]